MKKLIIPFVIIILTGSCLAQDAGAIKDLHFNPNEAESMVFMFNKTTVSGADVEMVAGLSAKLNKGMQQGRALRDTSKTVALKLTPPEIQFCLSIITNSTFEAKYAQLVFGMKRKLEKLLPKQNADTSEPKKEGKK